MLVVNSFSAFLSRSARGVLLGAAFAAAYCGIALVLFVLTGGSAFKAQHTTLPRMLLAYMCGGISAGLIAGIGLPLTSRRFGAAIVGIVACLPVSAVLNWATDGSLATTNGRITVIIHALLFGGFGGMILREIFLAPATASRSRSSKPGAD